MPVQTASVSLVIPVLNEEAALPAMLVSLSAMSVKPAELIFIDAGCRDNSIALINDWWQKHAWQDTDFFVCAAPDTFPGGARNAGIARATQEWVAFLDAGISPETDWLQNLLHSAATGKPCGVFGKTRFTGRDAITTAICALSYGQGATRQTLPSSMFRREVFEQTGMFNASMRAGEDLLWLAGFRKRYPDGAVASPATAVYDRFPRTPGEAALKWFEYERHVAIAGIQPARAIAYLIATATVATVIAWYPPSGLAICAVYLTLRGGIDPIRRSCGFAWWRRFPTALLLAPLCATVIDSARLAGRFAGAIERLRG